MIVFNCFNGRVFRYEIRLTQVKKLKFNVMENRIYVKLLNDFLIVLMVMGTAIP